MKDGKSRSTFCVFAAPPFFALLFGSALKSS